MGRPYIQSSMCKHSQILSVGAISLDFQTANKLAFLFNVRHFFQEKLNITLSKLLMEIYMLGEHIRQKKINEGKMALKEHTT